MSIDPRLISRWWRLLMPGYWRALRKRRLEAELRAQGLSGRQARRVASRMY